MNEISYFDYDHTLSCQKGDLFENECHRLCTCLNLYHLKYDPQCCCFDFMVYILRL